ncbi:conserved hypothetical protein [Candidatus Zixiibacteriota bacterium]|nr:conserved hypothetical protein [candidate division Zixibacteria bacterium]
MIIWSAILFLILIIIMSGFSLYLLSDKEIYLPYRLTSTMELIKFLYPESYNPSKMMELARDALFGQLDRYSGYLEPKELGRVTEEFSGSYGGIGITIVSQDQGLMVMSVREDGPAARAGMKSGDIIYKVDSTNVKGVNAYRATFLLRGSEGSPVELGVLRKFNNIADTLQFELTRQRLPLIHVPYAGITPGGSLYIRLLDFEAGSAMEVFAALDSLYLRNPDSIRGIIFDLRGNPGGLLTEAVSIAGLFMKKGKIVVGMKGRSRWNNTVFRAQGDDIADGLPIALLVDKGSASSSEILAGSLRYAGRAFLVGDTTFGKGLVQEFDDLGDGSGLRITTARYYFEGNIFLNDPKAAVKDSAPGIPPDYYYQATEYEPFPLELESSLLMREYAIENQDRIAADSGVISTNPGWLDDFRNYMYQHGFDYESQLSREIGAAVIEAHLDSAKEETIAAANRLYNVSRREDSSQFTGYKEYIRQRLFQVALETKFGVAESYRRAIVPYRWDIALAEQIFKESKKN